MVDDIKRDLFRRFVGEMNVMLKSDGFHDELWGRDKGALLNELFECEDKFRTSLLRSKIGRNFYSEFMKYIIEEKKNILSARVYFRERQSAFSDDITNAFREFKPEVLYDLRINYRFAKWIVERISTYTPYHKRMRGQYKKILVLRELLCKMNLPLVINRAKIFWSKSGISLCVDYLDLVQASAEGLLSAIDKFVPPYKSVFCSVAIGRMTLNMTTDNSVTAVKLSPQEKRILYRVNNAKNKAKLSEDKDILKYVNESFGDVTAGNLSQIMTAVSQTVSIDSAMESGTFMEDKIGDGKSLEQELEKRDIVSQLYVCLSKCPALEKKIILLKLGEFDNLSYILTRRIKE